MNKFIRNIIIGSIITGSVVLSSYNIVKNYKSSKVVEIKPVVVKQHYIATWQANDINHACYTGNIDFDVEFLTIGVYDQLRRYVYTNRTDMVSNTIVIFGIQK